MITICLRRVETMQHQSPSLLGFVAQLSEEAPVRRALDVIGSQDMASGFHTGRYNMRGVHGTDGTGSAERELAAQYRKWAAAIAFEYPFAARAVESLARSYDHEAQVHETDADVRRRLEH